MFEILILRRAPDLILSPLEILIALKNLFALEPAHKKIA